MISILIFSIGVFLCVLSIILVCCFLYNRKCFSSLIAILICAIGICVIYYAKNQLEEQREELERNIVKKEAREEQKPIKRESVIEALLWGVVGIVVFVTTAINMENYEKRMLQKIKEKNELDIF